MSCIMTQPETVCNHTIPPRLTTSIAIRSGKQHNFFEDWITKLQGHKHHRLDFAPNIENLKVPICGPKKCKNNCREAYVTHMKGEHRPYFWGPSRGSLTFAKNSTPVTITVRIVKRIQEIDGSQRLEHDRKVLLMRIILSYYWLMWPPSFVDPWNGFWPLLVSRIHFHPFSLWTMSMISTIYTFQQVIYLIPKKSN